MTLLDVYTTFPRTSLSAIPYHITLDSSSFHSTLTMILLPSQDMTTFLYRTLLIGFLPLIIGFSADTAGQIKSNWKNITGLFEQSNSLVSSPVLEMEAGEATCLS